MRGIGKRFGALAVLSNANLTVKAGTLHAVVGENGAGKSTLMRILYGALAPDEGTMLVAGLPYQPRASSEAIWRGVGMVSQHYGIIPELTALQNLVLGAEGSAVLKTSSLRSGAQKLADQMGFPFDWDALGSDLTPASAQRLEILKLLWRGSQILILDEPTAMLSPGHADAVFVSLNRLIKEGRTVILVTHRLSEVMDHAEDVTVFRGGVLIGSMPVASTNATELTRMVIGGEMPTPPPMGSEFGRDVITLNQVSLAPSPLGKPLHQLSLCVKEGEIVGVAGVDGSGQRELLRLIAGLDWPSEGEIIGFQGPTSQRLADGLRIIPEDRQSEGMIADWSLEANSALGLQRLPPLRRGFCIDLAGRSQWAQAVVDRFGTKAGRLSDRMGSLSGGNQQRFVAGRALTKAPRLLVAFQPVRGLDVKGAADVYGGIRSACQGRAGALVISFDLDELLTYADRIVVMFAGRLYDVPVAQARDRQVIGRLMVGQSEAAA